MTLDDYLMGFMCVDIPVKLIGERKANRDGQLSNVVGNALFHLTICSLLYRRRYSQYYIPHDLF